MFCKYCGNELPDSANFCPKCGRINETVNNDAESAHAPNRVDTLDTPIYENEAVAAKEKDDLGGSILKFAILGLAFGASVYLSVLGIIFSIISKVKLNNYLEKYKETEGRASVGKALGIAGMAVSITFTVIMTLLITIVFLYALAI